jgi:hypothetical protein
MRIGKLFLGVAAATTFVAGTALFSPGAYALTYNFTASGEATLTSLGDQTTYGPSPWDQLAVASNSGTFTPGTPFVLNALAFTVGINATIPYVTSTYDIIETVTFGGGPNPGVLTIPFDITIAYQDDISAIASVFGPFPGGWTLSVSAPDTGLVSTGQTFSYDLTALVTTTRSDLVGIAPTPLPAALPLFAGGLGILAFIGGRRKKRNRQSVLAAA